MGTTTAFYLNIVRSYLQLIMEGRLLNVTLRVSKISIHNFLGMFVCNTYFVSLYQLNFNSATMPLARLCYKVDFTVLHFSALLCNSSSNDTNRLNYIFGA
jgi:hypothetical protein